MENILSLGRLAQQIREYAYFQSKIRSETANLLIDFHSLPLYNLAKEGKLTYFTTYFISCQEERIYKNGGRRNND